MLLDDTPLPVAVKMQDGSLMPWDLSPKEIPQAGRALKGSILRQEVYALDGTEQQDRPYSVSERNYTIDLLQPREANKHAVFFVCPREAIDFHYERKLFEVDDRKLADPRVSHSMTISTDIFGNVTHSTVIGYGRRLDDPDPALNVEDRKKQKRTLITYTENGYTNAVQQDDDYRAPLLYETRTYELHNIKPDSNQPDVTNLFRFEEMSTKALALSDGNHDIPYENPEALGVPPDDPRRRLIEHARTLYRRDNLSGPLLPKVLESRALPFESYKLVFTPGLLSSVYQLEIEGQPPENLLPNPASFLHDAGGYIDLDGNGNWWTPSGRIFFHPDPDAQPTEELAFAQSHFFQPHRFEDPFLNNTFVSYDHSVGGLEYNLQVIATRDAVGNQVKATPDYRVLQPRLVTDPNGNRTEVAFDALGMVVGTAVMGKQSETLGDSLADFEPDLDEATIIAHLQNPLAAPHAFLQRASTRLIYDLRQYERSSASGNPLPNVVHLLTRETHDADLEDGEVTKVQLSFSYCDGYGREIQKKLQAEPGPIVDGGQLVNPRWVVSGWTIFNNKGKPVRQYEPFFSITHQFELAKMVGVSPILFYDPVGRVVATLNPNKTYQKVVFAPWQEINWDLNDTVLQADPKNDPDVGGYFNRLPVTEYLPTWYAQRQGGALGPQEQAAANKAAIHANTPSIIYSDVLGRAFLTVLHNRFKYSNAPQLDPPIEEFHLQRVIFDIQDNQREVVDAKDRIVLRNDYDMLHRQIHQSSMEAGERWMLNDVTGKPIFRWNSHGHIIRMGYDKLRRLISIFRREVGGPEQQVERLVYGEAQGAALNHRGRVFQHFDAAGLATTDAYDFKGNLVRLKRQFAADYKNTPNWSAAVQLEAETYSRKISYDGLNRPATLITPDNSIIRTLYNEANLPEQIEVNLGGALVVTTFVAGIDYNAKGQREAVQYGNGINTSYEYDPLTSRLIHQQTLRGAEPLQDLFYTYDSIGNITETLDGAQQTIFFNNQAVEPHASYTYDAVYRLIEASGREHIGQGSQPQTTWDDQFRVGLPHPNDGQAMRRYIERYAYDEVGNMLQLIHSAVNGDWTRAFTYGEPSLIEPGTPGNRLSSTTVGATTENYAYDIHGNVLNMAHLPEMFWDFEDQLQQAQLSGGGKAYYVYDAGGLRVRKVIERQNGTREKERIYLGDFETYREYDGGGNQVTLERETLHVMDGQQRVALVETRTLGSDGSPQVLIRNQISNYLGSSALEVDESGQIISYEEYYPYGNTSFQAVRSGLETNPKRYRYTGKERDEETGLFYHGARYYAPWLARWTAADPAGVADGLNLYAYGQNNPIMNSDASGTTSERFSEAQSLLKWNWRSTATNESKRLMLKKGYENTVMPIIKAAEKRGIPLSKALILVAQTAVEQSITIHDAEKFKKAGYRMFNMQVHDREKDFIQSGKGNFDLTGVNFKLQDSSEDPKGKGGDVRPSRFFTYNSVHVSVDHFLNRLSNKDGYFLDLSNESISRLRTGYKAAYDSLIDPTSGVNDYTSKLKAVGYAKAENYATEVKEKYVQVLKDFIAMIGDTQKANLAAHETDVKELDRLKTDLALWMKADASTDPNITKVGTPQQRKEIIAGLQKSVALYDRRVKAYESLETMKSDLRAELKKLGH